MPPPATAAESEVFVESVRITVLMPAPGAAVRAVSAVLVTASQDDAVFASVTVNWLAVDCAVPRPATRM